jgi:5-methylcytosine-specific restriction protein A
MTQFFYAYHSLENREEFDSSVGYGVSEKTSRKLKNTQIGDLIYVVQARSKDGTTIYQLCGMYEITEHYEDKEKHSSLPHRARLSKKSLNQHPITIEKEKCCHFLPQKNAEAWSKFQSKLHQQGVSLQNPLDPKSDFVTVFNELLEKASSLSELEAQFATAVAESARCSSKERIRRLASAKKLPISVHTTTKIFLRNPDVVAETLYQAKGVCAECGKIPFIRRSNGQPYLEVHHKIPLSDGGEDTLANAIALCPNCHREKHFG